MIIYNLKELIDAKSEKENRKIPLTEVAEAAGVQKSAISKMAKNSNYSTTTKTLDALCNYFDCKIEDIITYKSN
ncbi:helix-turn-helix transcriptional regulator [Pseudoalteromonas shioyasakiensis]|uniref:helix-turn-helix domain-containing protein n=1 Tax=Pseudoalteromonas shioyasakiensis TaxID=1190813 RepID=UPI0021182314|nr:helix-turn-helix transcriptional regulator [Pseudoalteromonas shioyasakiensis]MCQ8876541.1 helix-turn-helix transcriptional regulator [Pseudoalteromonas shioyasakiensis]